jgi:hypothetical protein
MPPSVPSRDDDLLMYTIPSPESSAAPIPTTPEDTQPATTTSEDIQPPIVHVYHRRQRSPSVS